MSENETTTTENTSAIYITPMTAGETEVITRVPNGKPQVYVLCDEDAAQLAGMIDRFLKAKCH